MNDLDTLIELLSSFNSLLTYTFCNKMDAFKNSYNSPAILQTADINSKSINRFGCHCPK